MMLFTSPGTNLNSKGTLRSADTDKKRPALKAMFSSRWRSLLRLRRVLINLIHCAKAELEVVKNFCYAFSHSHSRFLSK